nr:retrovirus-related Pol polyprotein from transposon TNT 1-94 [Tanacetum cinerariifolium]
MTTGQRKPEGQLNGDERKAANLDQRLKSLIMFVLPDDQMNSVINCLIAKSTWDDLILYHEGPSDVKESRVMDLKLCYNTFKFEKGSAVQKQLTKLNATNVARKVILQEIAGQKLQFPYINNPFNQNLSVPLSSSQHKLELRPTKDFKVKYNKVKAKLALLSSKEVSSDDNEMVEVKVLMALAEENDVISKEVARNAKYVKISMRKCDIRKPIWYLDSECSRHMTDVKSYLHKYMEQPGTKDYFSKKRDQAQNPQHVMKSCETCGITVHTTTDHNDIKWFRRGKELQAKKAEALKLTKAESSNANRSKTPTRSKCSRHMTDVKSYLHKYIEQPGTKVMFEDDSTCTIKGYGSIKCNGIVFTKVAFVNGLKYNLISISQLCDAKYIVKFDKKRGTIFNSNKEVVIAPRYMFLT